jgi:hypothetical protein
MSDLDTSAPQNNPPAVETPAAPNPSRDVALHDAFMLGWAIVELGSRIQMALAEPEKSGLQLSSVWRATFNKIAGMQLKTFPQCTTASTLYEPPAKESLPYLYPPEPDYANVGIKGTNAGGVTILDSFALYGVTRRAINCLTLLYVKPDESLIPDVIKKNQDHLVAEILKAAKDPGGGGGNAELPADKPQSPDDLQRAKEVLTERTVKFLNAWDGYLRENYYTGGAIPDEELELVAYEAGHSLSGISWGIAAATVPLEQPPAGKPPADRQAFVDAWKTVFRDQSVIRLQHQISALSSALDDSYYAQHTGLKRSDDGAIGAINPDLPSQAIQAVKNSIDYWQRAVDWIANPDNQGKLRDKDNPASWSNKMRLALSEQANIWQTLMTGQQTLRAYNMESVTHKIMDDVTDEIQQGLHKDFGAGVHQAQQMMKEMAQEVKDAITVAKETAVNGLEELFKSCKKYVWLVGGAILLFALVLISVALIYGLNDSGLAKMSGGVGISGVLSAVLGYLGLGKLQKVKADQQTAVKVDHATAETKVTDQATAGANAGGVSLLTRIEGAAQQTGTLVLQALERGYEQARIELDGLNRSVAVAYPLMEFFGLAFTLESDAAFLTEIIWSGKVREEEIKRMVRAAFGPLAVFMTPSEEGSNGNDPQTS